MSGDDSLHQFRAYQKACELFDHVVCDVEPLARHPVARPLVAQQVASADSISSNIEEGYGRRSKPEYIRFLVIARGSATETRGRYEKRFAHWLARDVITSRVQLCDEVIAMLSATIRTLRSRP